MHPLRTAVACALAAAAALTAACSDKLPPEAIDPRLATLDVATADRYVTVEPAQVTLAPGQTATLTAVLHYYGTPYPLPNEYVTWATNNPAVATISAQGIVTAVTAGQATITATHGVSATATVTVAVTTSPSTGDAPPPPDGGSTTGSTTVSAQPELPRTFLDSRYPAVTGRTLRVPAGGDLQGALDVAQPGDEILLQAGATYVGNFYLRAKPGASWIVVRTDGTLPPEGTRVTPQTAAGFAKIVTPNSMPAVEPMMGAHHWRLTGLEIAVSTSAWVNYGAVSLGAWGQASLDQVPHDIVLDRVYVHGYASCECKRGIDISGASQSIVDSYVTEFHSREQDTQALLAWNGPGPYKIVNNFLAASGENVMFGGAKPTIAGVVPSDIEFRRNHLYKPLAWRGVWVVKNLFEVKNAQRVLVEGNVAENNWSDAQDGVAWVLKTTNDASWMVTRDLTVRFNLTRNSPSGLSIVRQGTALPEQIVIAHNRFDAVSERLFIVLGPARNLAFSHNTGFPGIHVLVTDGGTSSGVSITDNLVAHGAYGIFGSGAGMGTVAITQYFPDGVVRGNVLIGGPASAYPAGNYFPSGIGDVQFVSYPSDPRLSSTSPYRGKATDGTDPGVDGARLSQLIQGATSPTF